MSGTLSRKIVSNNPVDIFKNNAGTVLYTIGADVTNNVYKVSGTALGTTDKMILDQSGKMTIGGSEFKFATSATSVVDSSIIVSDVTGTDVSGKKLILKSGGSTGSADGGAIEFHTSKGVSTGSTPNTHTAALTIAGNGNVSTTSNMTIGGNLIINGTSTVANSSGDLTIGNDAFIKGDLIEFITPSNNNIIGVATTGVTNANGGNLTIRSGKSNGTGTGGIIDFQTTKTGSSSYTSALTIAGDGNITAANNVTVTGNLTVNGSTTTVNVDTVTIKDPVIELGTSYTTDTTIDRGMKFIYGPSKIGFMGYDNSAGKFIFLNDATESSNVFTPVGTNKSILLGNLNGYILDDNNNAILKYTGVTNAANEITISNAATGGDPNIIASGTETNISLQIQPKGTGTIKIGGTSNPAIISAVGAVSISNTTASNGTGNGALVVSGGVGIGGACNIGTTCNVAGIVTLSSNATSSTTGNGALVVTGGVGIGGACNIAGALTSAESTTTSDQRLKTNIQTINNAINKVNSLRGVYFEWIDKEKFNDRKQIGLIAQEVETVCPELVVNNTDFKTVNYAQSVGLLVEAIKEQQIMIQSLKEELELLKTQYAINKIN